MSKIELSRNKVLKLTNAVVVEITEGLEENLELIVMKIENYIRSKGYTPNWSTDSVSLHISKDAVYNMRSFTFETVLSSSRNVELLKKAKNFGYQIEIVYVLTADPQINVSRVAQRVKNRISINATSLWNIERIKELILGNINFKI